MIPMRAGRSGQIIFGIALAVWSAPAFAEAVDLELVLATDNSQSIDRAEAALQRQGVAAAFRSPEVVRAIQSGSLGRIGVAYLDWSSAPYTRIAVSWRVIKDKASADAFVDALLKAPPGSGRGTAIGEALALAAQMIETNDLEGTRRAIDVSGDGPNNTGRPVAQVRDEIVARGFVINGLPIVTDEYGTGEWGAYYGELDKYYMNCVIGGRAAFALPAKGFQEFAVAIRRKLVLEISEALPKTPAIRAPIVKVAAAIPSSPSDNPLRRAPGANQPSSTQSCGGGGRLRGFGRF
jgi:hypothetical protein